MPLLDIDARSWGELSALLDEAVDLPVQEHERWLAALDARHEPLKPYLREMLARRASVETDFLVALPKVELPAFVLDADGAATDGEARRMGPYRLLRELGSGGMGSVWLAERADGLIQRPVALKFPRGAWIREGLRERMARERDLLASLEHPAIARLYDAGVTEAGDPYLALEYVDGQPLDEHCAARGLTMRERIELVLQVADAVAYAHSKLIVHRDLKPANILVTARGEARLLDFGVGKLLDEQQAHGLTELAGQALTPDYASPEQIAGAAVTVATDVYSLGVVLYELLAERRPYRLKRDSRGALEEAILEVEPQAPSRAAPGRARLLRGDLDAIVLKALRKDPRERYATVHALADDLRRYLYGHPVLARPAGPAYRVRKLLLRHKLATAAVGTAVAALVAGTAVALWQAEVARAESRRAESATAFIASIFQGVDPSLTGAARPLTALEVLEQAERRVSSELERQPDVQTRLRAVIAQSYLGLFEPQRARDLASAALSAAGEAPDAASQRSLHLLMARALIELTELDEADRHLALVLEGLDPLRPDAEYVEAKLTESELEYRRGAYDAAAEAAAEALAAAERAPAIEPSLLLEVEGALGRATGMQREADESLLHNRRAFELALEVHGGDRDHPQVLQAEHNLAASLIDVAQIDEALPHLERSLAAARTVYGDDSLIAGRYAVRLGLVRMERGELESAIELIDRGLAIESAFESGPSAAMSGRRRTLGRAYIAARRLPEALPHLEAAIDIMRPLDTPFMMRVLEADHAFLQAATTGALAEGIATLERIIAEQDRGDPRYKTHLPDYYAGVLRLWAGDNAAALRSLERGVELARAQTRESDLGEALTFLGYARLDAGDVSGAAAVLEEALERLRNAQVAATPAQAEALLGLGRVALERGARDDALRLLGEAAAFWNGFDANSRGAGVAAFWLGAAHARAEQPDEARAALATAVRVLEGSPLPADATLAGRARDLLRAL